MSAVKEFFDTRIKKNCAWYAIPMAILFTWQYRHTRNLPFDGGEAAKTYFAFFVITYIVLMLAFFVLYMIGRSKKH